MYKISTFPCRDLMLIGACRAVIAAAQALGISLDIGFMWRLKENAAYPGKRGRIRLEGSGNASKIAA